MTTRDLYIDDLTAGRSVSFHGYLLDVALAGTVFNAICDQRPGVSPDGPANCANWTATVEGGVLIEMIRETARRRANADGPAAESIDAEHRYRMRFIEF